MNCTLRYSLITLIERNYNGMPYRFMDFPRVFTDRHLSCMFVAIQY